MLRAKRSRAAAVFRSHVSAAFLRRMFLARACVMDAYVGSPKRQAQRQAKNCANSAVKFLNP
jgi:hypothetical protein